MGSGPDPNSYHCISILQVFIQVLCCYYYESNNDYLYCYYTNEYGTTFMVTMTMYIYSSYTYSYIVGVRLYYCLSRLLLINGHNIHPGRRKHIVLNVSEKGNGKSLSKRREEGWGVKCYLRQEKKEV